MRRWGVRFDLDLNDYVQRTFFYTGWWEREYLELLAAELRPDDVYLDIGAHVGIDAAWVAARLPVGSVIAIEAVPATADLLERTVGQLQNVRVENFAAGDRTGPAVALRADPALHAADAATRSLFAEGAIVGETTMMRIDDWAAELTRLDVVKVDAEGSETLVVRGMRETLDRLRPRLIAVEVVDAHLRAGGSSADELFALLGKAGYAEWCRMGDNVVFGWISV